MMRWPGRLPGLDPSGDAATLWSFPRHVVLEKKGGVSMRARRTLVDLLSVALGAGGLAIASTATATAQAGGTFVRSIHLVRTVNARHAASAAPRGSARHGSRIGSAAAIGRELRNQAFVNRSLSSRTLPVA